MVICLYNVARVAECMVRDVRRSDIRSIFRGVSPFGGMSVTKRSMMALRISIGNFSTAASPAPYFSFGFTGGVATDGKVGSQENPLRDLKSPKLLLAFLPPTLICFHPRKLSHGQIEP